MGEAVVANRVKKAGYKKIACQRGGWGGGGGMRILGSGKFYDESSKISSLSLSPPPPPKVMNNDQFIKYTLKLREDNRSCSNSYVKLDITKMLQRKC